MIAERWEMSQMKDEGQFAKGIGCKTEPCRFLNWHDAIGSERHWRL